MEREREKSSLCSALFLKMVSFPFNTCLNFSIFFVLIFVTHSYLFCVLVYVRPHEWKSEENLRGDSPFLSLGPGG